MVKALTTQRLSLLVHSYSASLLHAQAYPFRGTLRGNNLHFKVFEKGNDMLLIRNTTHTCSLRGWESTNQQS